MKLFRDTDIEAASSNDGALQLEIYFGDIGAGGTFKADKYYV